MSHANAALTPRARLRLARLIVDDGWPPARAAERYDVAYRTAVKWAHRYEAQGPAGMVDRSSRPHRQPTRTPSSVVRRIVSLRLRHRLGPVQIGDRLGAPASTVHAVLVRCRLNRLSHIDRVTGERIRRYEHDHPGDLLHIDVKKLGNVPDGGCDVQGGCPAGREPPIRQTPGTTLGPPWTCHPRMTEAVQATSGAPVAFALENPLRPDPWTAEAGWLNERSTKGKDSSRIQTKSGLGVYRAS